MDTVLILTGAGVIVAAAGVAATVVIWVLKGVFNLGGLHMKVDALNEKVDFKVDALTEQVDAKVDALAERVDAKVDALAERVDALNEKIDVKVDALAEKVDFKVDALTERVDDLSEKVDNLAEGQRALHADFNRVINMLTALANHRHDVDGNIVFNVPPNP